MKQLMVELDDRYVDALEKLRAGRPRVVLIRRLIDLALSTGVDTIWPEDALVRAHMKTLAASKKGKKS